MTRSKGETAPFHRFAARVAGIPGSPIDNSIGLLQRQTHEVVSFAMGCPAPEAIPLAAFRDIAASILDGADAAPLNYGPTEGEATLHSAILEMLDRAGTAVDRDCLLVTAGGMQGLDLVCKLFVDAGDHVVVESPTYTNGVAVITSYGGRAVPVPVDDEGICVEMIAECTGQANRRSPKLIYVIPNFQNPRGVTLSYERRVRLLELADELDAIVVEDDPYGLLYFGTPPPPSLYSLDGGRGRVVSVHTFSKILVAGLRVGWVLAPPDIVRRMIAAKQGMDTCTNVLGQRIIAEFLSRDLLDPHIAALRTEYAARKAVMTECLTRVFGALPGTRWTNPGGGFFLWLELPCGIDTTAIFDAALRRGVAYIPGSAFSVDGAFTSSMRLCFAYPNAECIHKGVDRLFAVFDDALPQLPDITSNRCWR